MADTALKIDARPEPEEVDASQTSDWEVEEVLARFDKVGRDTRAGGTTSCH